MGVPLRQARSCDCVWDLCPYPSVQSMMYAAKVNLMLMGKKQKTETEREADGTSAVAGTGSACKASSHRRDREAWGKSWVTTQVVGRLSTLGLLDH